MARLSRNSGFDIRDEPEDCYDATGQFRHLNQDPVDTGCEATEYPDDESYEEKRLSRRRAAVAIALALAAGATTVVLARNPAVTPPAAPVRTAPSAPVPASTPEVRKPANDPELAEQPSRRRAAQPEPERESRPRKSTNPAKTPAAVTGNRPQAPIATSEPAGGEFILGAR